MEVNSKETFKTLIDKFIEDYLETNVKKSTKLRYMTDINIRIIPEFGNQRISNISYINILNFQNFLVKKQKKHPATINRCMTVLSLIFSKGVDWGICRYNPCTKIKCLKEIQKPYRWWRDRQTILKFLNHAESNHYFLLYRLALETGMRLGELTGLLWDAVNLESGQIEVYRQFDVHTGMHGPLKNNQHRTVWIPTSTIPLLRELSLKSSSDHVFTKPDGTQCRNDSIANSIFKNLQTNANVPIINFHGLRHTYASHYMMNGGDLYDLSKLLGHSSIEVTMKYAHLSPESLRRNRDRVSFDNSNVEIFKYSRVTAGG
jgi:integrase